MKIQYSWNNAQPGGAADFPKYRENTLFLIWEWWSSKPEQNSGNSLIGEVDPEGFSELSDSGRSGGKPGLQPSTLEIWWEEFVLERRKDPYKNLGYGIAQGEGYFSSSAIPNKAGEGGGSTAGINTHNPWEIPNPLQR